MIAIPVFDNRISARLDCTQNVMLVSIENGVVKERERIRLVEANPLEKMKTLIEVGVQVVICGGITDVCINKLKDNGVKVIPWIRGEAEEVLKQYLEGKLGKGEKS